MTERMVKQLLKMKEIKIDKYTNKVGIAPEEIKEKVLKDIRSKIMCYRCGRRFGAVEVRLTNDEVMVA